VLSPLESAKKWVPILRPQVDLLILVTHIGVDEDKEIASKVPGVDIIVGGHSHTRLAHGIVIQPDHPSLSDPTRTIILQDGHYTPELGELQFTVEPDASHHWRVTDYTEDLLPLTDKIKDDPATARVVSSYYDQIKKKDGRKLGVATSEFTTSEGKWTPSYNLFADAMQWATHADLALEQNGGLRAPLLKGIVTGFGIGEMNPYVDSLAVVDVTGDNLDSIISYFYPATTSGVSYENHHHKKSATEKEKWVVKNIVIDGKPLDRSHTYHVAMSSWLANASRDNVVSIHIFPKRTQDVLAEYVQAHSPISPHPRKAQVIEEGE